MSIRTAIVAPTGYTGFHLIDLLLRHPGAKLTYLASHRDELPNIAEEFPQLRRRCEMTCRPIDAKAIAAEADVVFTCLPHKAAMEHIPPMLDAGLRVVDLSADYRISDPAVYEAAYNEKHTDPTNLADAVYGLPEFFRDSIAGADLVANPGCYPTAALLGIGPLIQRSLVKTESIIIDAASGVTGAGRAAKAHLHFPEVHNAFFCYGCGTHRHQPEMNQVLSTIKGGDVGVLFVPHLLPIDRGILATIYMDPLDEDVTEEDLFEAFEDAYADQPFVRIVSHMPNVFHVRESNYCDITVRLTGGKVVVFAAIDNLIKGASGQAMQNMNLMFDQEETAGLL